MPVSKARTTVFSVFHNVLANTSGTVHLLDRNGGLATGGYCEFLGGALIENDLSGTFDVVITDADGSTLLSDTGVTATADIDIIATRTGYRGPFTIVITNFTTADFTIALFFRR